MRFIASLLTLLSVSVSISSVNAVCSGAYVNNAKTGGDFRPLGLVDTADPAGGTPSSDALPLFYTRATTKGDLGAEVGGAFSAGGLTAMDAFCNREADPATITTFKPELGDSNLPTTTVSKKAGLYKAIASSVSVDAIDRFGAVYPDCDTCTVPPGAAEHDVVDANNHCIAANVGDLFISQYVLNKVLSDQTGNQPTDKSGGLLAFTGSTSNAVKWYDAAAVGATPTSAEFSAAYCGTDGSDGWNSQSGTTSVGTFFSDTNEQLGRWIGAEKFNGQTNPKGCTNGVHIICMQAAPAPTTPSISGDPQFNGLQGQSFQVHGMPEEYFNLISLPDMQMNSRFTYLASGQCNYNNTECWTHPGTYVDQLGFMFPGLEIKVIAGTHDKGMTVWVNDKRLVASQDEISTHQLNGKHSHGANKTAQIVTVSYTQHDRVTVSSPLFTITTTNSDMFFNFGVSLHSPSLLSAGAHLHHIRTAADHSKYPSFPLHGLLGQTWKNARYANGRFFAGSVDDYMMLDSKLFSTNFMYNQYMH